MTRRALSADGHRRLCPSRHPPRRAGSGGILPVDLGRSEATVKCPLGAGSGDRDPRPQGPAGIRELDLLVHSAGATIVSFDADQVLLARSAYEKFGKGHHPAALNLGDCCSYALARSSGEPLLFKGNDFSKTDVAVVERSHP